MFTRFSAPSRRALRAAEQECRNRSQYYVGVEHLMLALLDEADSAIDARLRSLGVGRADLYFELRAAIGTGEERTWEGILITPRLRSAVHRAEGSVSEGALEPVHLFDAIVEEGGLPSETLHRVSSRVTQPTAIQ